MKHPSICIHCGAELAPKSIACPACGSDENTGWSTNNAEYESFDEIDYEDIRAREFGESPNSKFAFPWRALVAIVLVLIIVAWSVL